MLESVFFFVPEGSMQSCVVSLAEFYRNAIYTTNSLLKFNNTVFFELIEKQQFLWEMANGKGRECTKSSSDLHHWHILNLSDSVWNIAKATFEAKGAKYQCYLRILLAETQQIWFIPVKAFNSPYAFLQRWMPECCSCLPGANGAQAHFPLQWSWNQ